MRRTIGASVLAGVVLAFGATVRAQELPAIAVPISAPADETVSVAFVGDDGVERLRLMRVFPVQTDVQEQECALPCRLLVSRGVAYRMALVGGAAGALSQWTWIVPARGAAFSLRHEPSSGARPPLLILGGFFTVAGAMTVGLAGTAVLFVGLFCGFSGSVCGVAGPAGLVALGGAASLAVGVPMLVVGLRTRVRERVMPLQDEGAAAHASTELRAAPMAHLSLLSMQF
jgi:hypothetical protein